MTNNNYNGKEVLAARKAKAKQQDRARKRREMMLRDKKKRGAA